MGKIFVKNGTPVGAVSLCKTCSNAKIIAGYRESELITICDDVHPNLVVPFNVYECTAYWDKNRPSWDEMKKLAIHVEPKTLKPAGFKVGIGFKEAAVIRVGEEQDDDDDE